jgi:hypothetical protein
VKGIVTRCGKSKPFSSKFYELVFLSPFQAVHNRFGRDFVHLFARLFLVKNLRKSNLQASSIELQGLIEARWCVSAAEPMYKNLTKMLMVITTLQSNSLIILSTVQVYTRITDLVHSDHLRITDRSTHVKFERKPK